MSDLDDKKLVSDAEIKAVEEEIRAKQAEEMKKLSEVQAKEIEEKVRKEFAEKQEKEKLAKQLKEQEDALKKAREETEAKLKAQQEAFEKRLAELEATKKGVATNDNPFKSKEQELDYTYQRRLPDGSVVDTRNPETMSRIEEESRRAWMEKVGIRNEEWGKPAKR